MVEDRKSIVILALLANELVKVAENAGIKLEKFEGLDPKLFKIYDYEDFKRVIAIMKIAGEKHRWLKSTMLQDLEKGKKTEIDYLNGYIENKAEEIGIETPINKKLIKTIKEIESGKRKLSPKNIDEVYKRIRIPKKWLNFNEKELKLAIFNLPIEYKLNNALMIAEIFLMGTTFSFSRAFSRITNSIIGKLLIRKNEWEISNMVLEKFLEEFGSNFSNIIIKEYGIKEKNAIGLTKIITFILKNLNMESCTKLDEKESIIEMNGNCIFMGGAEKIGIKDKINFPICKHIFNGISKNFNASVKINGGKCIGGNKCEFICE